MRAWVFLLLGGLFEVAWVLGLKHFGGLEKPAAAALTLAGLIVSLAFLALGLRTLPAGTAYAVWTGIGSAGTALAGLWFFGESRDPTRLFCLVLIITGIIGLKLQDPS